MNPRKWIILRTLFNRYSPKDQKTLLNFFNGADQQGINSQTVQSYEIAPLLFQYQRTLERMHYSWIKPILKQMPDYLIPFYISALPSSQATGLKSAQFPNIHMPQCIKIFFQRQIYCHLQIENILPLEFLPATDFANLLQMQKKDLVMVADFLGLYDLAAEVRRIVNTTYLKNIYTCLSPKQFYYLKSCMHQKEKLVSPSLGIDLAVPNCQQLKQLIHKRGLIRLSKALCGQHKDFVWYLAHTLDTGRGNILLSQYKPEAIPAITSFLQLQLMNVMNFLKNE